ncbi:MAG: amidase [Bryobacteraceae bacterium]|nr:amidase [Solibacteraceae bacterium]MCO5351467.1 amidase [Bryobacteraceae bacterium]
MKMMHLPGRREFLSLAAAAALPAAVAQSSDPAWMTIAEAAALIRRKRLSPVELTRACLARTEALQPRLNAFITITAESALAAARAAEAEIARGRYRGPLHGIPIALKDLYDTAGVRTTAASAQWQSRVPTEDAEVVKRLKAAGAILTGKTNMDEFAYSFTAESSHFGPARNPFDPARSPGGSSGGSAVAVAAGMCLAALGSDTGGSIRLPASLCGVSGLKPTFGAVPTTGVAPLAWSCDHVGPLCRTAADTALIHSILAGSPVPAFPNVKTLRLGVPKRVFYDDLEPAMASAMDAALRQLGQLTAGLSEVRLPEFAVNPDAANMPVLTGTLIAAEAHAFHRQMLTASPGLYSPGVRQSIENGAKITTADYIHARRAVEEARATIAAAFGPADLLITPAAPGPAFPLGKPVTLIWLRNAAPWNLYGLPTLALPCGATPEGLPLGMQITGKPGREDQVIALGQAWQQATSHHRLRPSGL